MKNLVVILVLLGVVFAFSLIFNSAGYVLIALPVKNNLSLEMTFWVFLFVVLAIVFIAVFARKFYTWLKSIISPRPEKAQLSKLEKVNNFYDKGWNALIAADFAGASKYMQKGLKIGDSEYLALNLFFAYIANRDYTKAQDLVSQSFSEDEKLNEFCTSFLLPSLTSEQLEIYLKNIDLQNPILALNVMRFYQHSENWLGVLDILQMTYIKKILNEEEILLTSKQAFLELLVAKTPSDILSNYYAQNPSKDDLQLIYAYAHRLNEIGDLKELSLFLTKILNKNLDTKLLTIYTQLLNSENAKAFLVQLTKWQKKHGEKFDLQLAQAKALRFAGNLEDAESLFLQLYKQKPNKNLAFELAEIYSALGNMEKSINFLHQAQNFSNKES